MHVLTGLSAVADQFDGFILDLWGLIHDGETAYPGVVETFEALKAAGKKTILLSNAPRRAYKLVDGMAAMGIPRHLYGDVLSSGEATHQALVERQDPFFAALGAKAYHIGPARDDSVLEKTNVERVSEVEAADFILNTGPVDLADLLEDYQSVLEAGVARGLPMVCANPDEVVIRGGQRVICAGAFARKYEAMGGAVAYRGKPDPAVYLLAVSRLGVDASDRVAVVGDALETDVAGAEASGLASIWCTGGIHGEALGVEYGEAANPDNAATLAAEYGRSPFAIIPAFRW